MFLTKKWNSLVFFNIIKSYFPGGASKGMSCAVRDGTEGKWKKTMTSGKLTNKQDF